MMAVGSRRDCGPRGMETTVDTQEQKKGAQRLKKKREKKKQKSKPERPRVLQLPTEAKPLRWMGPYWHRPKQRPRRLETVTE